MLRHDEHSLSSPDSPGKEREAGFGSLVAFGLLGEPRIDWELVRGFWLIKGDVVKIWRQEMDCGLVREIADEQFEVDGILYTPPHVAYRMRLDADPAAPALGTGHVVKRPMLSLHADRACYGPPHDDCSGKSWRWWPPRIGYDEDDGIRSAP